MVFVCKLGRDSLFVETFTIPCILTVEFTGEWDWLGLEQVCWEVEDEILGSNLCSLLYQSYPSLLCPAFIALASFA